MKQILKKEEREKLQSKYQKYPLLLASSKVFTPVKSKLTGLIISAEDLFFEVSRFVDFFLFNGPRLTQKEVNGLWTLLINEIHDLNPNTDDGTKKLYAGIVFLFTKEILVHHCENVFRETLNDMLTETLENNLGDYYSDDVYEGIICSLTECSQQLDEWINDYDKSDYSLSDEIANALTFQSSTKDGKVNEEEKKNREVDEEKLSSHFKVKGFDKKTHIPVLKAKLEQNQDDKKLAQVALIIYESSNFIKKDYSRGFRTWYIDFCKLVGCKCHKGYDPNYLKKNLTKYNQLKNEYWFL